ncbi:hypothetical protein V6N12_010358 [Hibiscus sabdariffa]|uniref:Uncharacterized protein n=1 Tax=Hibiscus sabdariffa TaxID=183260 RepID=A0ABR2EJV5_9ROSI
MFGFLALYLSGKIRVFDRRGHVAKLCIGFLPLLIAALVGISRVDKLLASLARCFCWGASRDNSCIILLFAILSSTI